MSIYSHSFIDDNKLSLYKTDKFRSNYYPNTVSIPQQYASQQPMINVNSYRNNTIIPHSSRYTKNNFLSQQNTLNKDYNTIVQENMLECYKQGTNRNTFNSLLDGYRYNVGTYLNDTHPTAFQSEINMRLLDKQNELFAVKGVLENQINQNQHLLQIESDYCEKMKRINEELLKKVNELADENDRLNYERKKLQKNYAVMEEHINFSLLSLINRKPKEPEPDYVPPKENIKEPEPQIIEEKQEESDDEVLKETKKQYKLIKEKIYTLNMNHNPGKLDEIRKKKLEEDLRKHQEKIEEIEKNQKLREKYQRPIVVNTTTVIEHSGTKEELKHIMKNYEQDKNDPTILNKTQKKLYSNEMITSTPVIKEYSSSLRKMQSINPEKEQQLSKNNKTKNYQNKMGHSITEEIVLDDLSSKKISNEEKLRVLKSTINKIDEYINSCGGNIIIYKEYHSDVAEHKGEIRFLYEQIKNNKLREINIDLLPMLIFEIVHSNYNSYLNPTKLQDKSDYNEEDFNDDLSEENSEIFKTCLIHLKKMVKGRNATSDTAANFLSLALLNFNYDDSMKNKLFGVIKNKLK